MVGDGLGVFQQAIVLQVGGDAGRTEGVVAGTGHEAGFQHLALDHPVGVLLVHPPGHAGFSTGRAEEEAVGLPGDAGGGDILVEVCSSVWWQGTSCSLPPFTINRNGRSRSAGFSVHDPPDRATSALTSARALR